MISWDASRGQEWTGHLRGLEHQTGLGWFGDECIALETLDSQVLWA